jgi:outer membrane protein assembly factor BamB
MPRWILPTFTLPLLFVPLSARDATSPRPQTANWAHFRGPGGQGHVDDPRVPLTWSETKNLLWKTKLTGGGNSSPIIWGDKVFLTGASEGGAERYVMCLRTSDGKMLWQKTATSGVPFEKTYPWNGYASPSIATDGTHVVAFFGSAGAFCYDVEGKFLWKKNFGVFTSKAGWGTAASPFIYEDTVILNCDNDGGPGSAPAALVALETKTGKPRWSTPRDQGRGFSTPRLIKMAGGRIDLVLNGPLGVWGYDPKTGKEVWHCDRTHPKDLARFGEPLPVDDGERMFILSGRGGPYQVLKLPGKGDVTSTNVIGSGERTGHRDVASPIAWQGKVYTVDIKGVLSCFDFKTGKQLYSGLVGNRKNRGLGSPLAIRGKLLWVLDDGITVVIEPGDKLKIVGRNKLGDGTGLNFGASPAVANGRLFLRSQSYLYCIGEK